MCTEAKTSKEDDETDDNFQQSGKVRREGWITETMPETSTCVGYDWTRGNHLDNQRIESAEIGHVGIYRLSIRTTAFLVKRHFHSVSKNRVRKFEDQSVDSTVSAFWVCEACRGSPVFSSGRLSA